MAQAQTALKTETLASPQPVATARPQLNPPPVMTGLVGLNTRVDPAISAALLRASMERKIQRQQRSAVQDIVAEALTHWLTERGYLV